MKHDYIFTQAQRRHEEAHDEPEPSTIPPHHCPYCRIPLVKEEDEGMMVTYCPQTWNNDECFYDSGLTELENLANYKRSHG